MSFCKRLSRRCESFLQKLSPYFKVWILFQESGLFRNPNIKFCPTKSSPPVKEPDINMVTGYIITAGSALSRSASLTMTPTTPYSPTMPYSPLCTPLPSCTPLSSCTPLPSCTGAPDSSPSPPPRPPPPSNYTPSFSFSSLPRNWKTQRIC